MNTTRKHLIDKDCAEIKIDYNSTISNEYVETFDESHIIHEYEILKSVYTIREGSKNELSQVQ